MLLISRLATASIKIFLIRRFSPITENAIIPPGGDQNDVTSVIHVILLASDDKESFIETTFEFADFNQTLDFNNTNLDHFLCNQEHFESLTNFSGCFPKHDQILCWPPTLRNSLSVQPCFKEWNGVLYDNTEENATKFCNAIAQWEKTDYSYCLNSSSNILSNHDEEYNTLVYCIGYSISILALSIALIIFIYFKELRCLRNTLHMHLFCTYIFSALLWLITLSFQISSSPGLLPCMILLTLLHFFNLSNFFWMAVEGLYLYLLVVETFSRIGVSNKFMFFGTIGYGIPGIIALTWLVVKIIVSEREGFSSPSHQSQFGCQWMEETSVDWIFKFPACSVLIINLMFLTSIMWVLITKLRSKQTAETRQYRKASKALLVLIPLFGLTYLIVLVPPTSDGLDKRIFEITRAILLSTQGFSVAFFYCFLNSEVRRALKNCINRWRDENNMRRSRKTQSSRRFLNSAKARSSNSRTPSLRPLTCNIQKRESSATTTTILTEIQYNVTNQKILVGENSV